MMEVLKSKGVFSFLIELKDSQAKRQNSLTNAKTRVLEELGLVEIGGGIRGKAVVFTEPGRLFLNRLEAEELKQTAGKPGH
jgi:hypothetical protein